MKINTSTDLNGALARGIREASGLAQRAFWGSLGVSQAAGSFYENGRRAIPPSVKEIIFIRYIAGLNHDASTVEGAKNLRKIGSLAKTNTRKGNGISQ